MRRLPVWSLLAAAALAAPASAQDARLEAGLRVRRDSFARARRGGVRFAAGTDAGTPGNPHGSIRVELEAFQELGVPAIGGAERATAHLLACGRREIAFLGGASEHCPEFEHRHRGYRKSLAAAGLEADPGLRFDADSQENSGFAAAAALYAFSFSAVEQMMQVTGEEGVTEVIEAA